MKSATRNCEFGIQSSAVLALSESRNGFLRKNRDVWRAQMLTVVPGQIVHCDASVGHTAPSQERIFLAKGSVGG
ncbi:MAG TPA: hypothetical protein VM717_07250 [Chthoniobacterales bacterium]|jgi:hypothetical protein|nr:hypothetical protein [Chthoniobacterales bacterium]